MSGPESKSEQRLADDPLVLKSLQQEAVDGEWQQARPSFRNNHVSKSTQKQRRIFNH